MRLSNFLKRFFEYFFYLFIFSLPWQTKLILRSGETNYTEISLYFCQLVLFVSLMSFLIYKFRRQEFGEHIPGVWYFLAGLELFIFASFFVASDQSLALYRYLVFLEALGLFYFLREGTEYKGYEESYLDKLTVVYVFLASMFFQASLGVYQFLTQSTFSFKYLGLASHNPQELGVAVVETVSGRWLRAYGGFDHPNIFGGVLALALILSAYLLVKKKVLNSTKEVFESIFLFIFYFFGLLALFFSFSRAAWLALFLGFCVFFISLLIKKDRWLIGRFIALMFFSVVFLFIIAMPYRDLLMVRIKAETRLEQKSLDDRGTYYYQAADLIKHNLIFGVGVGNYTTALNNKTDNQPAYINQPVHNVFLLILAENGVFSLLFFVGFLICLILKDRRETYSGAILVVLLTLMMLDHWLISLPFGVLFLFFALGLI